MKLPFLKKKLILDQPNDRGWFTIFESYTGAFQQDVTVNRDTVIANHAVFTCCTLPASDISKLRVKLVKEVGGIWVDQPYGDYKVLQKPNSWQNRIQFFENWILSKLSRGNTYVLKQRDKNGFVVGMFILNPDLVQVLISESGSVFYRLTKDNLSQIEETEIIVPASEIIHDRFNCLFHPLIGLSPIYACGLAALQGIKIQNNSAKFFTNMSRPSGVLTAPDTISDETANRIKTDWQTNFGGDNMGKIAVLGDDLKYMSLAMNAEQSQLVEQLQLSAEIICSTFHIPKHKVIGDPPSYNNIEALEQSYYSQCLQNLIESIELCLDEGLEIPEGMGSEFDLDGLLRMDSTALYDANTKAVGGGWMKLDEARKRVNLPKMPGGDSAYLQEQNYSVEALAKRDANDPFAEKQQPLALPPPDVTQDVEKFVEILSRGFQ